MERLFTSAKLILATFLIALLAVSCTKEDVSPCGQHASEVNDGAASMSKSRNVNGTDDGRGGAAISTSKTTVSDDGSSISDDGDDLSDSEHRRKKPRN